MHRLIGVPLLVAALGSPIAAQAQEPPTASLGDSTELVFEREVFAYPDYQRRNPFHPLLDAAAGGPRFEELNLIGVVHHTNPRLSLALLSVGNVADADASITRREGAGGGGGRPLFTTYRLRRGDVIGNTRIIEIREDRVVVEVEEFGLAERRTLELSRIEEGGS